ncbi:MAG TPA: hypothetical protein DCS48_13205 [Desulfovibrio sp.]|nr:hypothetical protein [Desulfovibrio sp.]
MKSQIKQDLANRNASPDVLLWVNCKSLPAANQLVSALQVYLRNNGYCSFVFKENKPWSLSENSFSDYVQNIVENLYGPGFVAVASSTSELGKKRSKKASCIEIELLEDDAGDNTASKDKQSDYFLIFNLSQISVDEVQNAIVDLLKAKDLLPSPLESEVTNTILRTLKEDLAGEVRKNKVLSHHFLNTVGEKVKIIDALTKEKKQFVAEAEGHRKSYDVFVDNLKRNEKDLIEQSNSVEAIGDTSHFFAGNKSWREHFQLAKDLIAKGKYNLAQKQLAAASVLNPDEQDFSLWYEAANAENYRCFSSPYFYDLKSCIKRYSFYISPSGRAGAAFIPNFLSLHPGLYAPSYPIADKYRSIKGLEDYLVVSNERFKGTGIKFGFNDHGGKAWKEGHIAPFFGTDTFIQFVRDPISSLKSSLTHLRAVLSNSEQFALISPIWNMENSIDADNLDDYDTGSLEFTDSNIRPPGNARTVACLSKMRLYYQQGTEASAQFPRWEVFDSAEFLPDTIHIGMPRLLSTIGVDADYMHPIYKRLCYSGVNHNLSVNSINVVYSGHKIPFRLDSAGNTLFSDLLDSCEVAYADPDERLLGMGLNDFKLALCCPHKSWFALSNNERKRFIEEGLGEKVLHKLIIPTWVRTYDVWRNNRHVQPVKELSKEERKEFSTIVSSDIKRFVERFGDRCIDWDLDL